VTTVLQQPNDLKKQIAGLADRAELTDLLYRLGAALDERRFEDLRGIYSDRAEFEFSDRAEIGDLASAIANAEQMAKHFEHTHHVITNPIIELNGDSATIRANLVATHVFRNDRPGEHYDAGMVYRFTAIRTAAGWRLSHVKLQRIWSNGHWDAG
jgi:3-phenylpropionate/cinnamic acid dioxygenase small subunit